MLWPAARLLFAAALLQAPGALSINPGGFPNSVLTSVRGWRSWNAVMEDVTQSFITRQVDALTVRRLKVAGKPTSLLDLGFDRVGIDAGWNLCTGVNGSWHDESGHFIVDKTRFPDMKAMTAHAHSVGVKMDFYLNQDGLCPEGRIPGASARTGNPHYVNDANDAAALGFDGIKFDSGGGNDNMTLWAQAVNATGREMVLECCNTGGCVGPRPAKTGATPPDFCPFNMFRTGIDIAPSPLSTVSNLLDASRFLNASRPGCWAVSSTLPVHCSCSIRCTFHIAHGHMRLSVPTQRLKVLCACHLQLTLCALGWNHTEQYPDMLELGAPVVGPHAARYQPSRGRQFQSMCNASDGTAGDSAPRLSFEQGQAQLAGWCTVSSPLILGFDLANETEYNRWWPLLSNQRALGIQGAWAGSAGRLVTQARHNFTTRVPHGCTCEDMKDTRSLPEFTVWSKPLLASGAKVAALAINTRQDQPTTISVSFSELGLLRSSTETDVGVTETEVWSGEVAKLENSEWQVALPAGGHRWVILEA